MSFVREVSPGELLHMREDGMSNQEIAKALLDCSDDILTVKVGEGTVSVPFQKIGLLMNELAAIQRNIPRVKVGNEMW